jgi:hypothetical protein
MHGTEYSTSPAAALTAPRRNRYYFGKMLDVYHFELETNYGNAKRWLINRLVLGHGVICGLDVRPGKDPHSLLLFPGVAFDKWGREIIVPIETTCVIPPDLLAKLSPPAAEQGTPPHEQAGCAEKPEQGHSQKPHHPAHWVHMRLCYRECPAEPVRVEAGDCEGTSACVPGAIQERFCIDFKRGRAPRPEPNCRFPDVCKNGSIDYATLARWVSSGCTKPAKDPCIVLANIHVRPHPPCQCHPDDIDITVRPIVFSNPMLFNLICSCERQESQSEE